GMGGLQSVMAKTAKDPIRAFFSEDSSSMSPSRNVNVGKHTTDRAPYLDHLHTCIFQHQGSTLIHISSNTSKLVNMQSIRPLQQVVEKGATLLASGAENGKKFAHFEA
ncbi:MAG: hypothetical protein Q9181_007377, partial [Wetmoreana brouardii]